jgi:cob(I)alamin adenosyltransferase
MRLYTKRGDSGMTDLMGDRVKKTHPRVEAYGTIDELNSVLGMVRAILADKRLARMVERVQRDLFVIGAELATSPKLRPPMKLSRARLKALERQIDAFQNEAPTPRFSFCPAVLLKPLWFISPERFAGARKGGSSLFPNRRPFALWCCNI